MELEDPRFIKSLIEVSHIEFQTYDVYHRHLLCSSGVAQKILGYTKEEFFRLSNDFYEGIVYPDDLQVVEENMNKLMHSAPGVIITMTIRMRKSDGDYIWIYTRKIVTERNEKGEPTTITSVAEDISDFIKVQNQLKEKVLQLEAISHVNSHMVRGPVASIIGLINLIEEKDIASPHNLQVFNYLKEAIEKLDNVIYEINDLSRT
jgi:PAS domain S-box-containing protein